MRTTQFAVHYFRLVNDVHTAVSVVGELTQVGRMGCL